MPKHDHTHADSHRHEHPASPNTDPHDQHAHPGASPAAWRISIGLNLGLTVVEAVLGLLIGSMALLADAAHNLSDVAGLMLAAWAAKLALRPPDLTHTYGYARSTILAALANAALLLIVCGALIVESAQRVHAPGELPGLTVALMALLAMVINLLCARLFKAHGHDLNERGAMLHLLADAAVSGAVVVVGVLVHFTGWFWLDPLAGVLLSVVIGYSGWQLLRQALAMALDAVPPGVDLQQLRRALLDIDGVQALHDLHVWSLSTTANALTVHLQVTPDAIPEQVLQQARAMLQKDFGLAHSTIQVEQAVCAADGVCGEG